MSSFPRLVAESAEASGCRVSAVRAGVLACTSLPDPGESLQEMLAVAVAALESTHRAVLEVSRLVEESHPSPEWDSGLAFDIREVLAAEASYIVALVGLVSSYVGPECSDESRVQLISSIASAFREME